jgi:hypothetical protein
MDAFPAKHNRRTAGTLSCVDRIVFKGYLPTSWADSFVKFLSRNHFLIKDFQSFVQKTSHPGAHRQNTAFAPLARHSERVAGAWTTRRNLCLKRFFTSIFCYAKFIEPSIEGSKDGWGNSCYP